MAFIGESREDFYSSKSFYLCLDKKDSQIVMRAIGPVIGRFYRTYQYYKGIHGSGKATKKDIDNLKKAEEHYNNIIHLQKQLYEYLKP